MQPNDLGFPSLETSLRELRRALIALPDLGEEYGLAARIAYAEIRTRAASVVLELHLFEETMARRP